MAERRRGPDESARCCSAEDRIYRPRRKTILPEQAGGHPTRPAARVASSGEAPADRWRTRIGEPRRFRTVPVPQREGASRPWNGCLLLSSEDGEPSRGEVVE